MWNRRVISKQMVCLANSRKYNGRCIAGKEISGDTVGPWIRPVSRREKGELISSEYRLAEKVEPEILDILRFEVYGSASHPYQYENHRLKEKCRWTQVGRFAPDRIPRLLDTPPSLWELGHQSKNGTNNRVPESELGRGVPGSLFLITVDEVHLVIGEKPNRCWLDSKLMVRARFSYRDVPYDFDLTDPVVEQYYSKHPSGPLVIRNPYLCVSLSEPFEGYCYKLVATLFTEKRLKH